jgi:hypothetical protein
MIAEMQRLADKAIAIANSGMTNGLMSAITHKRLSV